MLAIRYLHRVKGGDFWRREVIQGGVDVPSEEAGIAFGRVLRGNLGLVETRVLRVFQIDFCKALVVVDGTVSDKLNLRNSGDRLEETVKDRLGVLFGFIVAVTVSIALRVESLNKEGIGMTMRSQI